MEKNDIDSDQYKEYKVKKGYELNQRRRERKMRLTYRLDKQRVSRREDILEAIHICISDSEEFSYLKCN